MRIKCLYGSFNWGCNLHIRSSSADCNKHNVIFFNCTQCLLHLFCFLLICQYIQYNMDTGREMRNREMNKCIKLLLLFVLSFSCPIKSSTFFFPTNINTMHIASLESMNAFVIHFYISIAQCYCFPAMFHLFVVIILVLYSVWL